MQKKIKVIHIITRLDKGGSAENVLITCKELDKNKYDTILVYGLSQGISCQLPVRNYKVDELVREISPLKDVVAFWKIYKIIKNEKPEIVHTHSSKAGFLGRWAAWLSRITSYKLQATKVIHTPHGHIFYGYYGKLKTLLFLFLERLTAKITDRLIALTEGEKKESINFGVGKPDQWTVIHSGVNPTQPTFFKGGSTLEKLSKDGFVISTQSRFFKGGSALDNFSNNGLVIGTVARLEPVKGVKYFVEAIKIIHNMPDKSGNYIFLIVGDGSERKILENKVEKYGLKDKVIFTGMREDVLDLISTMDIYVQPSLNEGMGKTLAQAMYLSKPIVATNVQGIPDVVINGETGILVQPERPDLLASAIVKLIEDQDLRKKMGEKGFQYAIEKVDGYPRFSIERMIFLLEKLYESLS